MKTFKPTRILMLLENNPYPADGRVRREATALVNAGHSVVVICPRGTGQPSMEIVSGVKAYRFPAPPEIPSFLGYLLEYGYATAAIFMLSVYALFEPGFDVVHTHNPPDTLVFVAGFYKLLGKRFVYDHHDLSPEMYRAIFRKKDGLVYRILLWLERISCRLADHVIATNGSYKTVEMERDGVPEERITIVRNGPDLKRLHPVEVDHTLKKPGKKTICYVGNMGHHDGVDYLLRALKHLVEKLNRPDFFCILVGGGEAWPELKLLAAELKLDDYVLFTGNVAHTEVARYLSAADICVAPEPSNDYNDRSTMIKMTEYLALGKATVAFDLPEHRVTAQEAALYAQPNNELDFARKLIVLMDDPQLRSEMGAIGRRRMETELDWSHQVQYLLEVYQNFEKEVVQGISVKEM
ncbi:MAG: glycosyltransferase family 4 protein [Anaerolineae bacterium]|nr:glycosyltransferase family 4 protein [Anaerolineae bacterium]